MRKEPTIISFIVLIVFALIIAVQSCKTPPSLICTDVAEDKAKINCKNNCSCTCVDGVRKPFARQCKKGD